MESGGLKIYVQKVKILFLILGLVYFGFCAEGLSFYKNPSEKKLLGTLFYADTLKELPIKPEKKKQVSYVKDKKGKKKKVIRYVEVEQTEPPEFVPVKCKYGTGYVKRAEYARFKERAQDLSGIYESATGRVHLLKSPNNPGKYSVKIFNGAGEDRAEFEAGNLTMKERNGKKGLYYTENGTCRLLIEISGRVIIIKQDGCKEYNGTSVQLQGIYDRYHSGGSRRAETFKEKEKTFYFKSFDWCPEGPGSCEKSKGEDGKGVQIIWSVGGEGLIERRGDGVVHVYRPYERMIPLKSDWFQGEKPVILKSKRTDMSSEWMLWYYYPRSGRLKMVRYGTRTDVAYTEIFQK